MASRSVKWTFWGKFDTRALTIPGVLLLGIMYGDWFWALLGVIAAGAYLKIKWK